MLDMLGMISQPDKITASGQIGQLEPWLVGNGQYQRMLCHCHQTLQRRARFEKMFKHFQRHDHIKSAVIELRVEQICTGKLLFGPSGTRFGQGIEPQIQAFIIIQLHPAGGQLIEHKTLATAKIQHAFRVQRLEFLHQRIVETAEAQPMQRVTIGIFFDVASGRVVTNCRRAHPEFPLSYAAMYWQAAVRHWQDDDLSNPRNQIALPDSASN